jgi:hypothetical protein
VVVAAAVLLKQLLQTGVLVVQAVAALVAAFQTPLVLLEL